MAILFFFPEISGKFFKKTKKIWDVDDAEKRLRNTFLEYKI